MPDWGPLEDSLRSAGIDVGEATPQPVHGGDIAAAYRVAGDGTDIFLKLMPASAAAVLDAEADGLRAIALARAVRVPER